MTRAGWGFASSDPTIACSSAPWKSIAFIIVALVMSLLLMFVLLVTQFNSLYQAALILVAVIMSTAGVLIGLLVTASPFSAILTGVGVVALAGIVVNNNIVLIDTYNHIRERHPELRPIDVIIRTGAQRFRPVLLTTVTTVFGLLPLASHLSIDFVNRTMIYGGQMAGFWVPLAQAIVSGLTFATLLTLVATPAMLALPHQPYIRAIRRAPAMLGKSARRLFAPSRRFGYGALRVAGRGPRHRQSERQPPACPLQSGNRSTGCVPP